MEALVDGERIMKKIIVLILLTLSTVFAADKKVFLTEAEIDSVIERAARRTDQKLNDRWTALLDSIMVEIHEQFLVEYKAELDSLKCEEAIWIKLRSAILQEPSQLIKKRLLKAISAKSRIKADSLLN